MNKYYTNAEIRAAAKKLKYVEVKEKSKEQLIFKHPKAKDVITHDIDSHNGGFWKKAKTIYKLKSRQTREGTYSIDLKERKGD